MLLLHAEALIRVQVVHAVVLLTRVLAVVLLPVLLLTLREAEGQVLEVVLLTPVAVRQLLHAVILTFQRDIYRPVSPATFRSVVAPWNGSFVRL